MQGFATVKRNRVADQVLVQLVNLIIAGDYPAGEKLPPERTLAQRMAVNRTSLREALRRLEAMGLISVRQGDGITVRDHSLNATLEFVKFLVSAGIGLDREFILSLEETRRLLAIQMIRLAADRMNEQSVERLSAVVEQFPDEPGPELLSGDWDYRLFLEIARATGNTVFVCFVNSIKDIFGLLRWLYCRLDREQLLEVREHNARLVKALAAGKKKKAVKMVDLRMRQDAETLASMLEFMPPKTVE